METKLCSSCKKELLISNFYKNPNTKDKLLSHCKTCHRKITKHHKYKYRYNITYRQAKKILKDQDYKCKICEIQIKKSGHLDHCHKTNKIRGYLCLNCNHGLGKFKDNPKLLKKAIQYLNKVV